MKCPKCGYEPTKGRPRKLNDKKVRQMRKKGLPLSEIALEFGVTRGAVQASLKRETE